MQGLAPIAMALWPIVTAAAFLLLRPALAVSAAVVGGLLFLPQGFAFDLPLVPALDRQRITTLSAIVCGLVFATRAGIIPRGARAYLLMPALLVVGAALTTLTNGDPVVAGPIVLPAMTTHDLISFSLGQFLDLCVPFLLGLLFIRRATDLRDLLLVLVIGALLYAPLVLFEVRMSPKLHHIVYGYADFRFSQVQRFGGWRPVVFMSHGLALALFLLTATAAAAVLWRARLRRIAGLPTAAVAGFLELLLIVCKSMASVAYSVALLPAIVLLRSRIQIRVASAIAVIVLLYPVLRIADLFPTETLVETAAVVSQDRADSLAYRFTNEDALLARFEQRPWVGWGSWGRNRIFDPVTGEDRSVTDGFWIIILGATGVVGFGIVFGMLLLPVFVALARFSRIPGARDRALLAGSALILIVNATDLLTNGFLLPTTLLLAGGLASAVPAILAERSQEIATPVPGAAVAEAPVLAAEATPALGRSLRRSGRSEARG